MPADPHVPAPLHVVLVGPGRLGRSMALALAERGHRVELVGRGQAVPSAPLTWLTVPDRSIAEAAAAVPAGGVVLHASGTCDLAPLRPRRSIGSLHPLMTFPGPDVAPVRTEGVPAAVAGDPDALAAARGLAAALGMVAFEVPGDRRLYHASAVIAGNFATVLLGMAAEALAAAGVPANDAPALLLPLARASLENAAAAGPAQALTGPIARGDRQVLDGHRDALRRATPLLVPAYEAMVVQAERLATSAALSPTPGQPADVPALDASTDDP
ncbi:MAG: DUF2520 domain-containing protein [Alphaproteobacteria bacterium]|nr:DUF2520 domain-containing protein [Alphaproteobacteria bacterium]